jgi:membrane associated rhomboid family serine protease
MNWLLIVANVLVFAAQMTGHVPSSRYALSPRDPHLYQFFTYQFLHAGWMHILGNMLFLYIFGNNVNDKMGQLGYLAFYLAGGVFAGVCYVLTQHGVSPVLGASGAVAAVTGAFLILFPRSHVTLLFFLFIIGVFEIQGLWFVLLFFAMNVVMSIMGEGGVAYMAHIGGILFGAVVCLLLLIPQLLPRDQYDVWALLTRWHKRRQYRGMVSKGYNPFDHAPGNEPRLPDPLQARVQGIRSQISEALNHRDPATAANLYLELKSVDMSQVLSRQAQLDIATQLHHEGRYLEASEAYERLLQAYPTVEQSAQVELMLGLIYARYLNHYDLAKQHLSKAVARLHDGRELELAKEELAYVESLSG